MRHPTFGINSLTLSASLIHILIFHLFTTLHNSDPHCHHHLCHHQSLLLFFTLDLKHTFSLSLFHHRLLHRYSLYMIFRHRYKKTETEVHFSRKLYLYFCNEMCIKNGEKRSTACSSAPIYIYNQHCTLTVIGHNQPFPWDVHVHILASVVLHDFNNSATDYNTVSLVSHQ